MVTINPAECKPGEVYEGTVHGERTVLIRRDACDSYPWESLDEVLDHEDVSSLVRLVPARPITRDDLPRVADVRGPAETPSAAAAFYAVDEAFDAVVEHLNRRFPKVPPVLVMPDSERPESEVDRWRRAHSIVEQERDTARRERDEYRDGMYAAQLHHEKVEEHLVARAEVAEHARDAWKARADAAKKARIEAAEARTAPAVTREEIEKAVRVVLCGNPDALSVRAQAITDAVLALVSGADPAVFVVRESDIAAVEVGQNEDGRWCAEGDFWPDVADIDVGALRRHASASLADLVAYEAVARAIEAATVDPLLDKAQEFAALADWELTDREAGLLHTVAAHVLGQEAGDE